MASDRSLKLTSDVGKIELGGATTLYVSISPQKGNFNVTVNVYLNLWNVGKVPAGSRTIYFQFLKIGTYLKQG